MEHTLYFSKNLLKLTILPFGAFVYLQNLATVFRGIRQAYY